MNLLNFAERVADLDRSLVELDAPRCLNARNRFAECKACFEICPAKAITTTAGSIPVLDQGLCQGCMACIPVCSVGAFNVKDDILPLLQCIAETRGGSIELICRKHPRPKTGINPKVNGLQLKGCLAALGVGAYVSLFALGIKKISLRTDACQCCDWEDKLSSHIRSQVQNANRILSGWSLEKVIYELSDIKSPQKRPLLDINRPKLSRRGLFRDMVQKGKATLACAIEREHSENEEKRLGVDRLRLINAIYCLPNPEEGWNLLLEDRQFASINVSDDCNACSACERACPTNAITYESDANRKSYQLLFDGKKCIGCGLCLHACLPEAIELIRSSNFVRTFVNLETAILSQGSLALCAKCNSVFAARSGNELCLECDFRKNSPFGSMVKQNGQFTATT